MRRAHALGLLAMVASACAGPPPTHALIVRHPERKCALIAFSGCGAFVEAAQEPSPDEDAGVDPD